LPKPVPVRFEQVPFVGFVLKSLTNP
jgi:hypothetical protein